MKLFFLRNQHKFIPPILQLNILYKLFYLFWTALFGILFFAAVYKYYHHKILIISLSVALWAVLFGLVIVFRHFLNSLSNRTVYLLLISFSLIMLLLSLWAGLKMLVPPFNDTGSVYYAAAEIIQSGSISREINEYTSCYWATETSNHDYFLIYPNNTFLVFYYLCYFKLLLLFVPINLYGASGYGAAVVLNSFSIVCATVFGFLTAKKAKDNTTAFLFLILSCLFVPYYLHAYKAYSDTLSLPYVTMALYFYVNGTQADRDQISVIFYILTGLSLSIGILIKGSILILLVAMSIYTVLRHDSLRRTLYALICLILVCASILTAWPLYKDHCSWIDTTEADQFELPAIHWVMMAAKGDGDYRSEDFWYSQNFPTYEERRRADTEEFVRRVQSYGSARSYISYEIKKVSKVMADGMYAQAVHLTYTFHKVPVLKKLVTDQGQYYPWFYGYITVYITLYYLSILASAFWGIVRKKHSLNTLFHVCLFGVFLFFAFWEFKSRYLLNFVPLFMLCTAFTLSEYADIYEQQKKCIK
ncbi:MAG: hypothetical protein K2O32_13000 [Acetatifactor sp.]|nr:hypothetical protein [Acetatifactor sp.]